jgi:hypothetical protein
VEYVLIADKASKKMKLSKSKITGLLSEVLFTNFTTSKKMTLWQDLELLKTQLNL